MANDGSTLSYDKVVKIREAYSEGKHMPSDSYNGETPTQQDVADHLGHSVKTVNSWVNADVQEVERLKEAPDPDELTSLGNSSERDPESRIDQIVKHRTSEEAMKYLSDEMMYGKFVREDIAPLADRRGQNAMSYIKEAVTYYESNKHDIDKLREQRDYFKKLAAKLYKELRPGALKQKRIEEIKEMIATHAISGKDVPDELMNALRKNLIES